VAADLTIMAAHASETSGITTRLILTYAQRTGGRPAVDAILRACDLADREAELLDEHSWFSYELKIRMYEAAAEALDDPDVMLHVGAAAVELNSGAAMKIALKALGSPRMVYRNIVRANGKFTRSHGMELLDEGPSHVRLRFVDLHGQRYHRMDCQYARGLLTCVPALFGQRPAEIRHSHCAADGADGCVYDIRWDEHGNHVRFSIGAVGAGVAAVAAAALLHPAMLPLAVAAPLVAGGLAVARMRETYRRRIAHLTMDLRDQVAASERLTQSLHDLASELRLDDLLALVTANARAAVGGKDFALLLAGEDGLHCQSSSGLADETVEQLERWAGATPGLLSETRLVDDVDAVEALRGLALKSVCTAPLVVRGEPVGVLIALAPHAGMLLPRDVDQLRGYALQAAIAVFNARLYRAQHDLATRDGLTGLLNHRAFHEAVGGMLGGAAAGPAVVLADLDNFKAVNDTDGHRAGDELLARVGAALRSAVREGDHAFRIGGDEFAVVLPRSDAEAAAAVAQRLRDAIDALDPRVSASVGIAVHPDDGTDREALLGRADARLYAMKREHHARASLTPAQ
jgi:diguanylate cyclase (GGDEF)-like protein